MFSRRGIAGYAKLALRKLLRIEWRPASIKVVTSCAKKKFKRNRREEKMAREGKKGGDSSETAKFGGEGREKRTGERGRRGEKKNGQKADEMKVKRRV